MTEVPDMNRDQLLARAEQKAIVWDLVVIGGGATGLGAAVDAAARGYRVLLLEQSDFGKGTSSRSTKLVHGGVRYLQQGNISLVLEALHERGLLLRNAPHLAGPLKFVVPCFNWWETGFYGAGLKLYDFMSRDLSLGKSLLLSAAEVLDHAPTVRSGRLRGGVLYYDGQFDDSRLAVNLAQTAVQLGGTLLNYARVEKLIKQNGRISGVVATELESGRELEIRARAVVNATGVFADDIRRMDQPDAAQMIRPSQGIHLVVDRKMLPGDTALMVPRTDDGRVLFAIPWHERVVIGTTDTPIGAISLEPRPLEFEIDFLLAHANRYLEAPLDPADVLSVFAGLRPLVSGGTNGDTASISRDHVLRISRSGLITITGGKWTTYRRMAEDTIDKAAEVADLEARPCRTEELPIHGWTPHAPADDRLNIYGSDASDVRRTIESVADGETAIHERLPYLRGEVHFAAAREMARTVEDVLSRRTRALLIDAQASIEAATVVASILAAELGRDDAWQKKQVADFRETAARYVLDGAARAAPSPDTMERRVKASGTHLIILIGLLLTALPSTARETLRTTVVADAHAAQLGPNSAQEHIADPEFVRPEQHRIAHCGVRPMTIGSSGLRGPVHHHTPGFLMIGRRRAEAMSDPHQERTIDVQGHRGARGLLPENTLPAFRRALEIRVNTLEMDAVISADGQVVVSHEPWMSHEICRTPDGENIRERDQRNYNIYRLTYAEIEAFDCGSRGNARFPRQEPLPVPKPLLRDVIDMAEAYAAEHASPAPRYNIEIKSRPENDGVFHPHPEEYARLLYELLSEKGVLDRSTIQSFDPRGLQATRAIDPNVTLSLLVDNRRGFAANIHRLGFIPAIYSPNSRLVNARLIREAHEAGVEVLPWTVNERRDMQRLLRLGVDGLITDYPDVARRIVDEHLKSSSAH